MVCRQNEVVDSARNTNIGIGVFSLSNSKFDAEENPFGKKKKPMKIYSE